MKKKLIVGLVAWVVILGLAFVCSSAEKAAYSLKEKGPAAKLVIDVSKSALLLLHFQNDLLAPEGVYGKLLRPLVDSRHCIEHTQAAARAARTAGMRVVYVQIGYLPGYTNLPKKPCPLLGGVVKRKAYIIGTPGPEPIKELKPVKGDIKIYNIGSDAFQDSQLDAVLRFMGAKDLYVAGMVTEHVVDSTVRRGANIGYNVIVLEDCCSGFTTENHDYEMTKIIPHYAKVIVTSKEFISALSGK